MFRQNTSQSRNDLNILRRVTAKPPQSLSHRCRRTSRPLHDARACMAEEDRSTIDLERPGGAIGHVAGLGGYGVGQAELIRGYQSVGHDPNAVPPCDRLDGGIQFDGRGSLQHTADPRQVVESVADPAQPAGLHEARQGLVDGLTACNVQEVLRRAQPGRSIVFGDPRHDLVGRSLHWVASVPPVSLSRYCQKFICFFIRRQSADGGLTDPHHPWPRVIDAYDELFETVARA